MERIYILSCLFFIFSISVFSQKEYRSNVNGFCPIHMDFIGNLGGEAANCYLHHTKPDPLVVTYKLDSLYQAIILSTILNRRPMQKEIEVITIPVKLFNYKIKPLEIIITEKYVNKRKHKRKYK